MAKQTARVKNLPELNNKLNAVKGAARGDMLKKAALAGGETVRAYARINANRVFSAKATNTLADSIQTEVVSSSANKAEVAIGPTVVYGRIQELGGWIKPVHAKLLHWVDEGVDIFAKAVHLPPRPYLRPAMDEHEDEITQAVGETIKREILKHTGKAK